jgi:hypothetical protein
MKMELDEGDHHVNANLPVIFGPFFFFGLLANIESAKGSGGLRISRPLVQQPAQPEVAIRADSFLPLDVRFPNRN